MERRGALEGLRVLDLTDETGRLAGRLLAETGADVIRLRRGVPGPPMKGVAGDRGGLLDWWFDLGTRRIEIDLDDEGCRRQLRTLVERAHVFIETEPPGRLARLGLDFDDLRALNPRLVHVSLTPFGRRGPRAGWQVSDLVASALGGPLSISGTPDEPLNGYGRQSFNIGGFFAAICALAGVHAARETGQGRHFDLSLHQSVASCTEQLLMYWFFRHTIFFPGGIAKRQAALHWTGLFDVVPCRDGHVMMTPSPNPRNLFDWLIEDGMAGEFADAAPTTVAEALPRAAEIMATLRAWAKTKSVGPLFEEAQRRRIPLGEVMSIAEAARSPQHEARGFFRAVAWDGAALRVPGPLFRLSDTPAPPPAPPPAVANSADSVLASWPRERGGAGAAASASAPRKPLGGVRILDFSWVLAGPMATRVLADLGADVVKLQTEERSQGVNHNDFPYFLMWNRNKRSATLNMKHPRAVETFRRLVERSDVVIDNFSPGVLDRWGVGYAQASKWNPRIIYVSLPGCGRDGPWRDFVTFAPTIQALSGLTYLTNPEGRHDIGFGFALMDHFGGLAGALAILAALEARRRTGLGQDVDISQVEVGVHLLGPTFSDYLNNGREAEPIGNRDAFEDHVPNEVYRCGDGEWLAITARSDAEWQTLCAMIGDARLADDEGLQTVAGRRRERRRVDERLGAWAAGQTARGAMQLLQGRGVPAGKVQNARDLVEEDEQLAFRRWLVEVEHGSHGRQTIDRFPAEVTPGALDPYAGAPTFGQHTLEVYEELAGMSVEEIAAAIGEELFS
jgi:crotonobetainyl-CoA:carnitine CoA-transferase CaiB-like acyl-CoA transferase